jgi:hypothetical protein
VIKVAVFPVWKSFLGDDGPYSAFLAVLCGKNSLLLKSCVLSDKNGYQFAQQPELKFKNIKSFNNFLLICQ